MSRPTNDLQLPLFTESILFFTLSRRSLTHMHQCNVERIFGNNCKDSSCQEEHLNRILSRNIWLDFENSDERIYAQPLLHFACMVVQAATLLMLTPVLTDHRKKALQAAQAILCIEQKLTELNYFKVRNHFFYSF